MGNDKIHFQEIKSRPKDAKRDSKKDLKKDLKKVKKHSYKSKNNNEEDIDIQDAPMAMKNIYMPDICMRENSINEMPSLCPSPTPTTARANSPLSFSEFNHSEVNQYNYTN